VEYEEWFDNPAANIEKLRKFLDLPWQQSESDLALLLSDLIDPTARHDDPEHHEANQPLVRSLYKLASRAGRDGEARDQIAYIVSQFVGFQQLQRPFQRAFEEVAKVAAKLPEVEQEAVALRAAVGERDAVTEAAGARATAVEERLAAALAEIEQQRAQIVGLAGERDEAGRTKATLADRETAVTEFSQRADELFSALQAAQAELAASEAALRRAEQETQERRAAAATMQSEIAGLREMLAQAEREEQERTAAQTALQSEIAALQEKLTAARQVGQAAIAAFRIDTAAPPKRDTLRGWRRALMRFSGTQLSF
jgi:DNA repair exonuclease SbcCD ATPase subunit